MERWREKISVGDDEFVVGDRGIGRKSVPISVRHNERKKSMSEDVGTYGAGVVVHLPFKLGEVLARVFGRVEL